MIRNLRISHGLRIYLAFWSLRPNRVVQANWGNLGRCMSLAKIMSISSFRFSKSKGLRTVAKLCKLSKILRKDSHNKFLKSKRTAMRMHLKNLHKHRIFLHTRKTNRNSTSRSFWICKWRKITCISFPNLTEITLTLYFPNNASKFSSHHWNCSNSIPLRGRIHRKSWSQMKALQWECEDCWNSKTCQFSQGSKWGNQQLM